MKTKNIILALVLVCSLLIALAFWWLIYAYGQSYVAYPQYPGYILADYLETNNYGYLRINPETILSSINKGDTEIFSPEPRAKEDVMYGGDPLYKGTYYWSQSDYFKIFASLNGFVWKDTLEDWSVYQMSFQAGCQESPYLRNGYIIYYKTKFDKGRILYTTRVMQVEPAYLSVAWGGGALFPHPLLGWEEIDTNRLKVTGEDALRIAEENGGREARLKIDNQCDINLLLFPEKYPGWLVTYNGAYEYPRFQIDPYDGSIIQ